MFVIIIFSKKSLSGKLRPFNEFQIILTLLTNITDLLVTIQLNFAKFV